MQSKAMEMLDNLDKNPATGMGKKVSTIHTYTVHFSFGPTMCLKKKNPKWKFTCSNNLTSKK